MKEGDETFDRGLEKLARREREREEAHPRSPLSASQPSLRDSIIQSVLIKELSFI